MSRKKFTRILQKRNSTNLHKVKKKIFTWFNEKTKKYKDKATPPTLKFHIFLLPSFDLVF